jgi:hypothetical protein
MKGRFLSAALLFLGVLRLDAQTPGDNFEPNNSPSNARSLTLGRFDLNFTSDDEDWFSFRITLPGIVRIATEGDLDTQLYLYGPNSSSTEIASDDDGGDNYNARITQYLAAGLYYIKAVPYDNDNLGSYGLVLETVDIKADSMEPNNNRSLAGTFSISRQPLNLTIFPNNDDDWFRIDLGSFQYRNGEIISLYTSGETDTYIELYQGDLLLDENDDSEGGNAKVILSPERGKDYYIKIRGYDDTIMGEYTLLAETALVELDQYEPNNTKSQAVAVSINQTLSGNALADYDTVDWFTFSVTQPGTYAVGTTGGMDTVITLYDGGDQPIGGDDDSGSNGTNALIEIELERGTYSARVSLYDGGYGEYSFFVRRR